jgi:hypothetical protein
VRKLPRQFRIWFRLKESCSRASPFRARAVPARSIRPTDRRHYRAERAKWRSGRHWGWHDGD